MQKEYWLIIISAILFGTITVGGQFFTNLGLSAFEMSLYSRLFIILIILPMGLSNCKYLIKKEMLGFFIIYGLIGALGCLTQFAGIVFGAPVAVVVLLLYSQPIWTTFLGKLMLKEKITPRKITAVALAFMGIIFLLKPWDIKSVGPITGIISALLCGIFLSLWVILGKKSGNKKYHYLTTITGYAGFTIIWLLLTRPFLTLFIYQPGIFRFSLSYLTQYWFYFLMYGLIAGVIPYSLFYKGVEKIEASVAGIILLLEPVSATILAAILFNQQISLNILLGGSLILLSNYLVVGKK